MFSAVMPMCTVSNGSVSAPTIMSTSCRRPCAAPQRLVGIEVAAAAHRFGAGADRDVGIAQLDRLRRADDRLQAAAAQAVHGERRRVLRQPALMHATREMYMSFASVWITLPRRAG